VTARALVRHAIVHADRLDPEAEVDDQIVTLLRDEAHTFRISTSVPARDPRWVQVPVLRTVNDLIAADDSKAARSNGLTGQPSSRLRQRKVRSATSSPPTHQISSAIAIRSYSHVPAGSCVA